MYEVIVCTCGKDLGSFVPVFVAMKSDRLREIFQDDILPVFVSISNVEVHLGDILDALYIVSPCCRMKMLTYATFRSYY